MKLVDANALLYAVNVDADRHEPSRRWLDGALCVEDTVAFAWVALLAFVRLTTEVGLFPHPLSAEEAMDRVDAWLRRLQRWSSSGRSATVASCETCSERSAPGGNLVNVAYLAALTIEHRCTVASYDHGFGRLPGISREAPLGEARERNQCDVSAPAAFHVTRDRR